MKAKKIVLAGALSLGVMSSFAAIRAVTPTAWDGNPNCLHPNERGYQIWLDAVLPTFREICGK